MTKTDNMVNIKLHGIMKNEIGYNWNLNIKSVSEGIHAINMLTKGKLYKFLYDNDKNGIKYNVLINNRLFEPEKPLKPENLEEIRNSELCMNNPNIKNIDIVPIIEGAGRGGSIAAIVVGVILIILGFFTFGITSVYGFALVLGGLGLVAAGVINLLTSPPSFDFKEIGGPRRSSFLFDGPTNTIKEGVPVPIGYGELIVGSATISASYEITDVEADVNEITI